MLSNINRNLFRRYSLNLLKRSVHTLNAFNLNNYRSLISLKGPDAAKFLQGLITNDVYHLNSVDPKIEYSMILNNKVKLSR